ncbi:zf-HC2 domain-containing protein [Streptomyces sp. NPDC093094]|uniref:zf-HC2 domain-containing protein n=1 Tax=Streptomyces sp. NPDC093094 TaxID=3366026 RepID=UPI0037F7C6EA
MSGVECDQVRELAAELALGVLPARERAGAVAHLDHCPDCREQVERLTAVGDGLLALLPGVEPPVGFESRVAAALGAAPAPRRRGHRLRLAAASVATAVACGFGGWAIGAAVEDAPLTASQRATEEVREAALVADGHEVGHVYAHAGDEGWVYMSVDLGGAGRGRVRCLLVHADGSTDPVGSFPLEGGRGHWGGPAGAGPGTVTGVRLVAADGSVLATARFPQS